MPLPASQCELVFLDHVHFSVNIYCHLKHVIEGKIEGEIEVMGRQGRRCKQFLDDLKDMRGCWKLKEEALLSPSVKHLLWKKLWTCHKTDYRVNPSVSERVALYSSLYIIH
jgi:hypothetical protein